ncbi:MAG: DUF4393 domain-containing protein [Deltaproteobacteria bacterium]|nr:DUF4393 domain-containing protein [Deltaproteobacteria bacterium]
MNCQQTLIQAKFNGMADVQKILTADSIRCAKEKVKKTGRKPKGKPKSFVLIKAIENASNETDNNIRDIWANLIANEILDNQIHPEFPLILTRLGTNDAITLAKIAQKSKKTSLQKVTLAAIYSLNIMDIAFSNILEEESDFSKEHLQNLNLTLKISGQWHLTLFGEEFLKAVADPTFKFIKTE